MVTPLIFGSMAAGFMLVFIAIMVLSVVGWIWAIIDIATAKNKNDNWHLIWILVVVLVGIIGVLVYLFVGRKDRKA